MQTTPGREEGAALHVTAYQLALTNAESAVLDPRPSHTVQRESTLLVNETSQLQAEGRYTPPNAAMIRKLAEDYVELAQASERDAKLVAVSYDGPTPDARAAMVRLRQSMAWTAHQAAIHYYTWLLHMPYPMRDEVQWFLALEDARVGDASAARGVAGDLVASAPDSAWAARAHFLLGVELAADASSDSSKHLEAEKEFAAAAQGPDYALVRVARQRLEAETRAADGAIATIHVDAPRAPEKTAAASPPPKAGVKTKPECASDFDCAGANACREGRCVDLLE